MKLFMAVLALAPSVCLDAAEGWSPRLENKDEG